VKKTLLATVLAVTTAVALPILAYSAEDPDTQQHWTDERGGGPGHWTHRDDGPGMGGWRGMMMHRMMMHRDPKERCEERLAWRAAMRAYTEAKLDLTPEQRPLWDKVQSVAQAEEQKERQFCREPKEAAEATMLSRLDRLQQLLSTRLEALQAAKPAVQALYQALTPEQRAIFDHPFRR
jgi:hypothetical protein